MKSIIELARVAGFDCAPDGLIYVNEPDGVCGDELTRFATLVRAAALDEAAGVCGEYDEGWYVYRKSAAQCATAIQQLKKTK